MCWVLVIEVVMALLPRKIRARTNREVAFIVDIVSLFVYKEFLNLMKQLNYFVLTKIRPKSQNE